MAQPFIIAGIAIITVCVIGYAVYQALDEEMFREERQRWGQSSQVRLQKACHRLGETRSRLYGHFQLTNVFDFHREDDNLIMGAEPRGHRPKTPDLAGSEATKSDFCADVGPERPKIPIHLMHCPRLSAVDDQGRGLRSARWLLPRNPLADLLQFRNPRLSSNEDH